VDVPAEQAALAEQVYKAGKPVITLAFGSPYLIERFFAGRDVAWCVWNQRRGADFDGVRVVWRDSDSRHLPVTVPGIGLKAGFGIEVPGDVMKLQPMDVRSEAQLQPAFDVIEAAVKDKAFPGATLAVGYQGKVSVHAFGNWHMTRSRRR